MFCLLFSFNIKIRKTPSPRPGRYARGLVQLAAERKVPADPAQWKCDETGATENLWLNLSTGFIGSGRQVRGC